MHDNTLAFVFQAIEEKCEYTQSAEEEGVTNCLKQAWISSSIRGFSRIISHFGHSRYKQNAAKASQGFMFVLDKHHGISVPPETVDAASVQALKTGSTSKREKLKETADKAKQMAKKKAAAVVVTN